MDGNLFKMDTNRLTNLEHQNTIMTYKFHHDNTKFDSLRNMGDNKRDDLSDLLEDELSKF